MAKNRVFEDGQKLSVVCSDPTTPLSGSPIRLGIRTGVAVTDEAAAANATGNAVGSTSVDFGPAVWLLSVIAPGGGVAVGDSLWYHDGAGSPPTLSTVATAGYFFGFAMQTIAASQTATIQVAHVDTPRPVGT